MANLTNLPDRMRTTLALLNDGLGMSLHSAAALWASELADEAQALANYLRERNRIAETFTKGIVGREVAK